jgi:class 3 adenylate cyclase/tetratricopeptide (TPR) repeat protein
MKCSKCQSENPDQARFCIECGNSLELVCPRCEAKAPAGAKFCMECGHALKGASAKPVVEYSQPQSYTPKFLADKILTSRRAIQGERKQVTVLFADVANYTAISERLDPEDVHEIMDGCFKILMADIHQREGTVNQFTGDGVMALFGAPLAVEDHAGHACHAALSIQSSLATFGSKIKSRFNVDFALRIGLNSGPVMVGAIGDDLRMDYTAVGDTTNLAARMENMAEPGTILVTANTFKLARDFFRFEPLGETTVKGKQKPQKIYRLIEQSRIADRVEASMAKGWTHFVGRRKEKETLLEVLSKARAGFGQVVGIVGEAGVGKSRLLLELKKTLPPEETVYLEGRCQHFGGSIAYLPFQEMLRSYFEIQESASAAEIRQIMRQKIRQLSEELINALSPLLDVLSVNPDDKTYHDLDPDQKREKIFEALAGFLLQLSRIKTTVLVIEDLHWIDKTSEELLNYLVGWLANSHLLLILSYRPEYIHTWINKSYYHQISLEPLPADYGAELVNAIFRGGQASPELRDLILQRTGGNPFFIEEFIHSLFENSAVELKDYYYGLKTKAVGIQIPATIEGVIAARMDRLEGMQKQTMQLASVIGRIFAFRILQALSDTPADLKAVLGNLLALEFIYEKTLFPELEYIFKHTLTQEVAYKSLLLKRRKELHDKIGQTVEQVYATRLEEFYEILAHHYYQGENVDKAFDYLRFSAEKAMRHNSAWEALEYYQMAVDVLDRLPHDAEQKRKKLEVIYAAIAPLISLGFPERSLTILEQGETLAQELADEHRLFRFRSNIGLLYCSTGDYPEARPYIEQAFEAAQKLHDIDLMAQAIPDLYAVYLATGVHLKCIDVVSGVLDLLEKNQRQKDFFGGPINVYSVLHSISGLSLAWIGNFKKALSLCEKAAHVAADVNDARTLAMCDYVFGGVLVFKGELAPAKEHLRSAIKYNEKLRHMPSLPGSYAWLGLALALAGDPAAGRRQVEKGLKIQSDTGFKYLSTILWFCMGVCLAESEEFEAARQTFEKGLDISRKNHERITEGALLIWLGRTLGQRLPPQNDRASDCISLGIEISKELSQRPDEAVGYLFLAELYANGERKDLALQNLKKATALFEEMQMQYWPGRAEKIFEILGHG